MDRREQLKRQGKCPDCKGHGADPLSDNVNWLPCPTCRGSGKLVVRRTYGEMKVARGGGKTATQAEIDELERVTKKIADRVLRDL